MTSLSYPLVAIGISDTNNFNFSLVAPPAGITVQHITAPGVDKWELLIDPGIFTTVGDTTLTLQVDNLAVSPTASAQFPIVVTKNPTYISTAPLILNDDVALVVDSSSPANLLTQKSITLSTNFPSPPTYTVLPSTTLINVDLSSIVSGVVKFTPTQYGDFYLVVNATIDNVHFATKTFKISIVPSHLYKLVDGQIEFDFTGTDASVGPHNLTFNISDSAAHSKSLSSLLAVKPSLTGIQVADTHLRYWTDLDTPATPGAIATLPITGSLLNVNPVIPPPTPYQLDNGLTATLVTNSGVNEIRIDPPASTASYVARNNTDVVIPISLRDGNGNDYGTISTTIRTMVINTNSPGLDLDPNSPFPFLVDVYPSTFRKGMEFLSLNPLKPYPNSPDITRKSGLKASLKSGQVLPMGLSLDSTTGLIYGVPQESWPGPNRSNPVTIEFTESPNILVGSVNIHFDLVDCYQTLDDQKQVPVSSRTLIAGTTNGSNLVFTANTITRTDISWIEEGVNITASPAVPTAITLLNFPDAGITSPSKTVKVVSVTDTRNANGVLTSSVLTISGASFTPSTYNPALAPTVGIIKTQTFLRTASVSANIFTSITVVNGHMPNGLEAQVSGNKVVITGVPSEFGIFDVTLMAFDNLGMESHWILSRDRGTALEVPFMMPLEITTTSLPNLTSTDAYSYVLQARGGANQGTGPYAWGVATESEATMTALNLAFDLAIPGRLYSTALLPASSTITTYPITFVVTDSNGLGESYTLDLTYNNSLKITTTSIPLFSPGIPSHTQLTASGGQGVYTWDLAPGSTPLPSKFVLTSGGDLQYTNDGLVLPATPSPTPSPTFRVTDSVFSFFTKQLNVQVQTPSVGSFTFTKSLSDIKRGWAYSGFIKVSGGTAPYYWSSPSGLPPGITWTQSPTDSSVLNLSGITTLRILSTDIYNPTFTVIDSLNASLSSTQRIDVVPGLSITTTSLPQVRSGALHGYMYYGDPYAVSLGGDDIGDTVKIQVDTPVNSVCTFSDSPTVLSLFSPISLNSSTGVISGNYSSGTIASTNITFTVTNGIDTVSAILPMSAVTSTLNITNVAIPSEPSGQAWTYQLVAQGGNPSYMWGLTNNLPVPVAPNLPINGIFSNSNIKFNAFTGELSGNASISGRFPVSFQVTDNSTVPAVFSKGFFLTIGANQVVTPGPDTNYIGYIGATTPGNTLTLNPSPNKSFTLRMTKVSSPTISVAALDPSIQAAVVSIIDSGGSDGRVATISISNIPTTTLGDHSFGLNVTDGTTVIPVVVKYKAIASRNITITQATNALLPTENV